METQTQTTLLNWNRAGKGSSQAGFFPVENIEEATWNPNTMPQLQYEALLEDMKQNGSNSIDPVLLGSKRAILEDEKVPENLYIVLNGNHRLRIARELGWKEIKGILDTSIADEATARLVGHNKNFERGSIDPYKEAELINFFLEKRKWTQEKVAAALHLDVRTVRNRLSLLKITPEVRKDIDTVVVKGTKTPVLGVSHAEVIARAAPEVQKAVVETIREDVKEDPEALPSVEDVTRLVKEGEQEFERKKKFLEALAKSQFKTCPTCKKPAISFTDTYNSEFVFCQTGYDRRYYNEGSRHSWSLSSGKTKEQLYAAAHKEDKSSYKSSDHKNDAGKPDFIRSTFVEKDFLAAFTAIIKEAVPKFDRITSAQVHGYDKGNKMLSVSLTSSYGVVFDTNVSGLEMDFRVEPKSYKAGALKAFKTLIRAGTTNKKKLAEFEQKLNTFMKKWAGVAPSTEKKLTKQQREAAKTAPLSGFIHGRNRRNRKG